MSRDVLYRCEDTIMTRLIGLYIEVRENSIDCKEPALDHINRRSIKYWQYEERRRQFMLCVERLRDNYNTSSISSIPTNSQCDNL
ncbi:hypothetical protein HCN44_004121 [Aphidius gifuensis]|uniref:Uncharacterized protein n=1 Tax=Aphidius gifuensis TaxID=684658 RepID=A0A835CS64_APHGI|nr:hypothetical protein HCN44_004121 [Aphidius gifuensis]